MPTVQSLKSFTFALLFSISALGLSVLPARAVPLLLVDASGQLTGAQNVDVLGAFFDVTFVEGTCIALFTGCDQASDFTFNNDTAALAAAQALINQVFVDTAAGMFDTLPQLTFGCAGADLEYCRAVIPYAPNVPGIGLAIASVAVNNAPTVAVNGTGLDFSIVMAADSSNDPRNVFAIFRPAVAVPEPSTLLLLGAGLAGVAGFRWRRRPL